MIKKLLIKLFAPKARATTAGALAQMFDLELRGAADTVITGIAPIADAGPGQITFYSTETINDTFKILPIEVLKNTRASVIILQPKQIKDAPKGAVLLVTDSPRSEIVKILSFIYAPVKRPGIARGATVMRGAKLGKNVVIEPGAYIGSAAIIGDNTVIGPNAFVDNATIGSDCSIHACSVIGKDGFGFIIQDGKTIHIPHVGRAILGDRVNVGSNSIIERGTLGDTTVGDDTKIGNLVQIAHNCKVGKGCFMTGNIGISGAVTIGDNVMIGGGTVINNKVNVGANVQIGGGSALLKDIPSGETWIGYPAMPAMDFMRQTAWLRSQIKNKK